jgi:hypothetical protein
VTINRLRLLESLSVASVGLTGREVLEQSHSFIFSKGNLLTFNDEVLFRAPSPLQIEGAVPAEELLAVLNRFPDDELDATVTGKEIVLKGRRRAAGIAFSTDILLPIGDVPSPTKFSPLGEDIGKMLIQAARTCGRDFSSILTTMVHITPNQIEGSDNHRLFRYTGDTGCPESVLIPASGIETVATLKLRKISVGKGWVFFKAKGNVEIAIRSSHETYHDGVDAVLKMDGGEKVSLPSNLKDILGRAEIMQASTYDAKVEILLEDGQIEVSSRKESGWFRERKKVPYSGPRMEFDVNPAFLIELLSQTRDVVVDSRKMKVAVGNIEFVVALRQRVERDSGTT